MLTRYRTAGPACAYALLILWVVVLHGQITALVGGSSLVASDPPAHFTSGVLVYEYLRSAFGTDPMLFAESFYVRYPKVALGQWPPGYYGLQAIWYNLFGVSIWSAQWLSALTAALLVGVLFGRLRRSYGTAIALGSVLLLLAMPLLQQTVWAVMSDLLTALLILLALLAFVDLLSVPRRPWAGARFLLWALLAILTKGTAWALGPFVVLAPLLARRTACYRARWYWGSGLVGLGLAGLLYLLLHWQGIGYPINVAYLLGRLFDGQRSVWEWLAPLQPFLFFITPLALALALLGGLDALWARWWRGDESLAVTEALVALAWVLAQALFLLLLPLTQEGRALLPALAPTVLLLARLLYRLQQGVRPQWAALVPPLFLGLVLLHTDVITMHRIDGYRAAAAAIPYEPTGTLILVASDPPGEGAFIVERLVSDPQRAGVILRAGQLLADSNWMGTEHQLRINDPAAVGRLLKELLVRYVVIDSSGEQYPEQALLRAALAADPAGFVPVAECPVSDSAGERQGVLRVYENPAARGRYPAVVRVRLGQERGGRVLEYRWP